MKTKVLAIDDSRTIRNLLATGWITKPFDDASLIFALKRVTGAAA